MYPEGAFRRIGSAFDGQDVDFDDHPEFSNAFVLKSKAEDETRDSFDRTLLDFFAEHPDITFEARTGTFLYFRNQKQIEPNSAAIREFMDKGLQAFRAMHDRDAD